nr:aldo/keto reductase [Actinomycetales bacterium]
MAQQKIPTVRLRSGVAVPRIGLGTWPLTGSEGVEAVASALDLGYRLLDTAENYRNEDAVGQAVRESSVPRENIVVTTKFNKEWHSIDGVREVLSRSLDALGLDYVDILLIHWPNPGHGRYVHAFEGMLAVQEDGLVRSVGTSNFLPTHLDVLASEGYIPEINQIQLDPLRPRNDVVAYMRENGIVGECWSPLGKAQGELLEREELQAVADAHGVTPAQVVLRWEIQRGLVPIPKSASRERQAENLDVFGFELSEEEMQAVDSLEDPQAKIDDPDRFGH